MHKPVDHLLWKMDHPACLWLFSARLQHNWSLKSSFPLFFAFMNRRKEREYFVGGEGRASRSAFDVHDLFWQ